MTPRSGTEAGAFNRYSPLAIDDAIRHSLDGARGWAAREEHAELLERVFSRLPEADVVVLTLGLSEAWWDREAGRPLNKAPSPRDVRATPDRYELRVLSASESHAALDATLRRLAASPRAPRVLLTVSPVPLHSTFRARDVLLANTYSKAALRVVAEELSAARSEVTYVPSFEIATLSDPRVVWGGADFRHVDRDFVRVILGHTLAALIPPRRDDFERMRDAAMVRLEAKLESPAPAWERIENEIAQRVLSGRQLRKYRRGRDAFFGDSSSPVARLWGDLTRRR